MNIPEVTDSSFDKEVLQSDSVVLVDFWAPWCSLCQIFAPTLEELSEVFDGKIKFVKINADENFEIVKRYLIRSIPAILFFRDGRKIATSVGFRPKMELKREIESILERE